MGSIDPAAEIGRVTLTVRDLPAVSEFYRRAIGLEQIEAGAGRAVLGTARPARSASGRALVELVEDREAPLRPPRTTGLFHLAILVPDRVALARSLRRLLDARWPLQGASDHLVSEALYVADPEGNGIEIYRDRPREDWRRDGDELRMATLPLDLDDVLAELGDAPVDGGGVPTGTAIGHVHLNVRDLAASERFYADRLGFAVTARGYPGALFLAAGGYHHHIGLNVWRGQGAPPPPAGALGLRSFEIAVPGARPDGEIVRDPSGNAVRIVGA